MYIDFNTISFDEVNTGINDLVGYEYDAPYLTSTDLRF
jgi:hypothetical protein